jgi:hypothetical protein
MHDVVVAGGGLSGVCAAIAAARLGCSVALIQDRPVLGGNSSSEIRVPPCGADFAFRYSREAGIFEEMRLERDYRNRTSVSGEQMRCTWDMVLLEWVKKEPNITLHLNSSVRNVVMKAPSVIASVIVEQLGSERTLGIGGEIFLDTTGDGTVGSKAGAEYRMGRESGEEFDESCAPLRSDQWILPSTIMFAAKDTGKPVPFIPPPWARRYPRDEDLSFRDHRNFRGGYWWIETGGTEDTIHDNEKIRDDLLAILYGVWDHIKNHGDHGASNYALDWIGQIPGKRESRRLIGEHILSQKDLEAAPLFPDRIAHGGWPMDLHECEGTLSKNPGASVYYLPRPYSIPFRCLYSRNVRNLMFAGRNISVSHVALSSTRIMGTCASLGQVIGTAAHLCLKHHVAPKDIGGSHISQLQQLLLRDNSYIIGVRNEDKGDVARSASVQASSSEMLEAEKCENVLPLDIDRIQLFPTAGATLEGISLLVESHAVDRKELKIAMQQATSIYDFDGNVLVTSKETVPPQKRTWVQFRFEKGITPGEICCVHVFADSDLGLAWSLDEPLGTQSACFNPNYPKEELSIKDAGKEYIATNGFNRNFYPRWRQTRGTYCFRVTPPVKPYGGSNVVNGIARPEVGPNAWVSDSKEPLPQHLDIDFDCTRSINTIYLTFDIDLSRGIKYLQGPVPECVRDYELLFQRNGAWARILEVKDNYQGWRKHVFDVVSTRKLRLLIKTTNGSKNARIYEIRAGLDL